jgi:hypothetical protein
MDEAQSAIFPEDPSAAERPVDFLANPVRVQTAELTGAQRDRRPYTRLDLVALANVIVRVEADHVRLVNVLTDVRTQLSILQDQVQRFKDNRIDAKLSRMLTALAQIEFDSETDDDPEDRY